MGRGVEIAVRLAIITHTFLWGIEEFLRSVETMNDGIVRSHLRCPEGP